VAVEMQKCFFINGKILGPVRYYAGKEYQTGFCVTFCVAERLSEGKSEGDPVAQTMMGMGFPHG